MATLSLTNSFIAGTLAKASEVNANFTDIVNWANGNVGSDNIGTLTGTVTWNITTGVKAVDITTSGNETAVSILQTTALNPNKAVLRIEDTATEISGDAVAYFKLDSIGSTIPALRVDYAGSQVFAVKKDRLEFPVRTTAERNAIATPATGSVLFISDASPSGQRGLQVYSTEGWSHAGVPAGTVIDFMGSTPPDGYLACTGTAVSRTTYATLFAVIGTTWGVGDGSTTFNVPDLRRRTTIGSGGTQLQGPATTLGSVGGHEELQNHTHTAITTSDGAHNHDLTPGQSGTNGVTTGVGISATYRVFVGPNNPGGTHPGLTSNNGSHTHPVVINTAGTGGGGNYPPAATVNKYIKW